MKKIGSLLLVLFGFACVDKGPALPHTSIKDSTKRNEIRPAPVVATFTDLSAPESVLYDPQQDVYFISNLNGGLLDRDNNGFISRVDAKTLAINPKWIEAGKNNVALDAPKGMAIVGDSLYVSDIAAVRKFDRRTGAPQAAIPLPGAMLINDLTSDGANVYASDTGLVGAAGDKMTPTGTDAIWKISNDQPTKIAGSTELKQPNGLAWAKGKLWVATFGGNEIYQLDGGKKTNVIRVPREQLDGLVVLDDGTIFVSSWYGNAVYRGGHGDFTPILQSIVTPADIGYDSSRHLLLVPATTLNHVTVHRVR